MTPRLLREKFGHHAFYQPIHYKAYAPSMTLYPRPMD